MNRLNGQERVGAGLAAGSMLVVGGSVAASSLLGGYPVLGGQGIRYLVAGLLLAAWARLRRTPLPRPAGREWAWLAGLAVIGLAGCSVLLILATRVANPASVGVVIGAAPLVIVIAAAAAAGHRPTRRALLAAAVVTAGSAVAQLGGTAGTAWSGTGLLLAAGALGGAVGTSLLAAPVLPRLGALSVTIYACGLAGVLLLGAAAVASFAGGPPILRIPTATQLAALSYLAVAVTAVVVLAWYAAMKRLGVDRTGLFNGLIPITALAAVALTGTGTITPLQVIAALTVLAGVILGLAAPGGSLPGPSRLAGGLPGAAGASGCGLSRAGAQLAAAALHGAGVRAGGVQLGFGLVPALAAGLAPEGGAVGLDGVDLPAFAVGCPGDPELVLPGVAAGRVPFVDGGQACFGQAGLLGVHGAGVGDLDAQVVEAAALAGVLQQDELEGRLGDGEVGVAGAELGRLGAEQLAVEGDGLGEVLDVEGELDAGHGCHLRRS
jgi:drug/metabolite transporter (DMT)-like permease